MNHLLALEKENADERQSCLHSCPYCSKVLKNYQALGGHLRAHQDEIKLWRNLLGSNDLSNVTDTTSISCNLLSKRQRRKASAYDDTGYARGPYALHPSLLSGSDLTTAQGLNFFRPPGFSPSENNLIIGSPLDPSSSLGPNGCQFNTNESRTFRDMPIPDSEASSYPYNELNRLLYSRNVQTNSDPSLVTSHLLDRNGPTTYDSLRPGDGIGSSRANSAQACRNMVLNSGRGENCLFRGVPLNMKLLATAKRQINFKYPLKKELLLFKDVDNSLSGMGIPPGVETEDQPDLDLSLHL